MISIKPFSGFEGLNPVRVINFSFHDSSAKYINEYNACGRESGVDLKNKSFIYITPFSNRMLYRGMITVHLHHKQTKGNKSRNVGMVFRAFK